MRTAACLALCTAALSASCVSNSREEPRTSVATPTRGQRPRTASTKFELIETGQCAATLAHRQTVRCRTQQSALADLDHDGQRDCIVWTRCGPDEPTAALDGGIDYPKDVVIATRADGLQSWTLYTNEQAASAERLDGMEILRIGGADERLLSRVVGYGSGNVQNWAIVDLFAGAPRRWTEPPLPEVTRVLGPKERLGKQWGRGVEVEAGQLEASWLVYRPGDANCCPSGGVVRVTLVPTAEGLRPDRIWREPIQ